MDEQTRKKVLVGGLAFVVLFFLVRTKLDNWIRGPIRTLQSDVIAAEKSAETLAAQEIQLDVAKRNLDCLPLESGDDLSRPFQSPAFRRRRP